jgi:hypothetical protein
MGVGRLGSTNIFYVVPEATFGAFINVVVVNALQ